MQHRPRSGGRPPFRLFLATAALAATACLGVACATRPLPGVGDPPSAPAIRADDLAWRVAALTDPATEGRATGSAGEALAAAAIARWLDAAGLAPAGDDGGWLHAFEFTAGVSLGPDNALDLGGEPAELGRDWRPLAFSRSGDFDAAPVVFVGYGLVAPAEGDRSAIDDYAEIEVEDRWVMVLRDLPTDLAPAQRRVLRRHAALRYKAMIARDRGARGILFVSGPRGRFRDELAPLRFDASLAGTSVAALSISDAFAQRILSRHESGASLDALQAASDAALLDGAPDAALAIEGVDLSVRVDLETRRARGTNVVGRLQVGARPSEETIVIGAHFDHLGRGEGSGSLADASEAGAIHPGADDNASGTALVVELAEHLAAAHRAGRDLGTRDFVFALWSGEELGLLGSDAWVSDHIAPHAAEGGPIAYLNFDMVGRLGEHLVVQGLGSSQDWASVLDEAAAEGSLSIQRQQDSYVPTDATSFYKRGVPILSAFTGVHADYHKPSDTPEKLDLDATARIGALFARIAVSLGRRETPPVHQAQRAPTSGAGRGGFRVFLGTIPDYANTDVVGVLLSGVQPEGPAETAGLRRGDVIITVDGRPIENLYDYTYALEAMQVGEPTTLRIRRDGAEREVQIVPASRE